MDKLSTLESFARGLTPTERVPVRDVAASSASRSVFFI